MNPRPSQTMSTIRVNAKTPIGPRTIHLAGSSRYPVTQLEIVASDAVMRLRQNGKWQKPHTIVCGLVDDSGAQQQTGHFFPITDNPRLPYRSQDITYLLGLDTAVYAIGDNKIAVRFKPDSTEDSQSTVLYLLKKIQLLHSI